MSENHSTQINTSFFNNLNLFQNNMTSLHTNVTKEFIIPGDNTQKIIMYSILFVISSIGNTTSFIALRFMNRNNDNLNNSKSRIRHLLMNLCIADLMVKKKRNFSSNAFF
jgi:hypothetical protein